MFTTESWSFRLISVQVGGTTTAATAVKVKDSIFGGINAFASVILADTSDGRVEFLNFESLNLSQTLMMRTKHAKY